MQIEMKSTVDITPELLGKIFCDMSDEQQCAASKPARTYKKAARRLPVIDLHASSRYGQPATWGAGTVYAAQTPPLQATCVTAIPGCGH
jgi:hypothetical protein